MEYAARTLLSWIFDQRPSGLRVEISYFVPPANAPRLSELVVGCLVQDATITGVNVTVGVEHRMQVP